MNRYDIESFIGICAAVILLLGAIARYKKNRDRVTDKREQKKYILSLYTGGLLFCLTGIFIIGATYDPQNLNKYINKYIIYASMMIIGISGVLIGYAVQILVKDQTRRNEIEFADEIKKEKSQYRISYICGIFLIFAGIFFAINR